MTSTRVVESSGTAYENTLCQEEQHPNNQFLRKKHTQTIKPRDFLIINYGLRCEILLIEAKKALLNAILTM